MAIPQSRFPGCMVRLVLITSASVAIMNARGQEPISFPPRLAAPWIKAGAVTGWFSIGPHGFIETFTRTREGYERTLPAFRFRTIPDGAMNTLPQPQEAFGIDLAFARINDKSLGELANLTGLQS